MFKNLIAQLFYLYTGLSVFALKLVTYFLKYTSIVQKEAGLINYLRLCYEY